jgi:hypothetical protein
VIRDRNMPVAKSIPFTVQDHLGGNLMLVASGAMHLPTGPLDLRRLGKMPRATVHGTAAVQAILDERGEAR